MKRIETPYGSLLQEGNGADAKMVLSVPKKLHLPEFWIGVRQAARIRHPSFQTVLDIDEKNGRVILEPVELSLGHLIEHGAIPAGISRTVFVRLLELLKQFEQPDVGFAHGYICPRMIFQRSGVASTPYSICLGFSPGVWFGNQVLLDAEHPQYVPPEIFDERKYRDPDFSGKISIQANIYQLGFSILEILAGNRLEEFFADPLLGINWTLARLNVEDKAESILNDIPDVDGNMTDAIRKMIRKRIVFGKPDEFRPRRAEPVLKELYTPYLPPITAPVVAYRLVFRAEQASIVVPPILQGHEKSDPDISFPGPVIPEDVKVPETWSNWFRQKIKKPYVTWPTGALLFVFVLVLAAYLFGPVKFRFDPVYNVVRVGIKGQHGPLKSNVDGYYRLEPGTYDFLIRSGGLTLLEKRLTLKRSKKLFDGNEEFDFESLTVPVLFDLRTDIFKIYVNGREVDWQRKKIRFLKGTYEIVAISKTKMTDLIRFHVETSNDSIIVETTLVVEETSEEPKPRTENENGEEDADEEASYPNTPPRQSEKERNTVYIHNFHWDLPRGNLDEPEETTASDFLQGLYSLPLACWDRLLPGRREKYFEHFCRQVCETTLPPEGVRDRSSALKREIYASVMQALGTLIKENSSSPETWKELLENTMPYWREFQPDDPRFSFYLGFLFLKQEKWSEAEESLTKAIEGGMENVMLYELRCTARENSEKWAEALEDIVTAMKLAPNRQDEFLPRQAILLARRGRWEKKIGLDSEASFREALDILERLLKKRPADPEIELWLNRVRKSLGFDEVPRSELETDQGDRQ